MAGVSITASLNGLQEVTGGLAQIGEKLKDVGSSQVQTGLSGTADKLKAATGAIKDLAANADDAGGMLGNLASRAGLLGTVFGTLVVAAGAWAGKQVKEMLDVGDAWDNLSQRTGIAVEKLAAYELLAKTSGTTTDVVAQGIKALSRNMALAADTNSDAGRTFTALGISVRDANGELKSAESVLLEIADKFTGMENGANKSAIATVLLRGAGEQLIPTLNKGSAELEYFEQIAAKTGRTMDTETAAAASAFKTELAALEANAGSLGRALAGPVVRALGEVAAAMREAQKDGAGFFGTIAAGFSQLGSIVWNGGTIANQNDRAQSLVNELNQKINGFDAGALATPTGRSAYNTLLRRRDIVQQQVDAYSAEYGANSTPPSDRDAPDITRPGKATGSGRAGRSPYYSDEEFSAIMREYTQARIKLGQGELEDLQALIENELETVKSGTREEANLYKELAAVKDHIRKRDFDELKGQNDAERALQSEDHRVQREANQATIKYIDNEIAARKNNRRALEEFRAEIVRNAVENNNWGEATEVALERIDKALDKTKGSANDFGSRWNQMLGDASFNFGNVALSIGSSWSHTLSDMFKGTTSITDGIKGLFKGLADAILGELARVAASSTMRLLFGGGTTVGALANFFGPGGSLAAGGDNGGGGGGGGGAGLISNASSVANLPSTWDKITSFFGGGSGATASEGAAAFSGATAGGEVGVAAGGATAGIGAGGAVGGTIGGGAAAFEGAVATGELSAAASGAGAAAGGVSAAGAASGIGAALVIAFGAWDIMTEKSLPYTIGYSIPSGKIGPNGIVGNMIARKTDKATGATQDFIQDPNPFSGQVGLWWQKFGLGDTPISVGTGFSLTPGMDYYSAILGASPQKDWPQDLQGLTPVNDDGFQLADYTGHYQHFSEQYPQIAAWYADKYGGMFPGVPAKFATGGSGIVTKPTMISLGENGPERFSVSPMASGDKGRGGLTINLSNVVMDEYGWNTFMRRVKRELGLDI